MLKAPAMPILGVKGASDQHCIGGGWGGECTNLRDFCENVSRLLARIVVIQVIQGSVGPSCILNNHNEALYGNGLTVLQTINGSRARPRWQDIELCKRVGCLFASKPKTQDQEY